MSFDERHHILTVHVENKAGVLSRVAGLFSRRGFNIVSLAVSPTDDERFSRMTIVVDADSSPLEQIVKQLNKLIPVIKITELAPDQGVERELMVVTVRASADTRAHVTDLTAIFATANGYVRRNALSDFGDVRSNGKIAMKFEGEDSDDRHSGVAENTRHFHVDAAPPAITGHEDDKVRRRLRPAGLVRHDGHYAGGRRCGRAGTESQCDRCGNDEPIHGAVTCDVIRPASAP